MQRSQRDLEWAITHPDPERELAFYRDRFLAQNHDGSVDVLTRSEQMARKERELIARYGPLAAWSKTVRATLFTGIPCELLYHDIGTANTSVAGTAAEVVMNLYNPFGQSAMIPAGFWLAGVGPIGRTAKLVIRGIWTLAASAGTAIFTTRVGSAQSTAATIGGITPTVIPATPAVTTSTLWEQELDLELQSFGTAGAASVLRGIGRHGATGWASPNTGQLTYTPMTGQTANSNGLTAATVDITINNFVSWNQNCTALTVTAIQLLQAFIYGMG